METLRFSGIENLIFIRKMRSSLHKLTWEAQRRPGEQCQTCTWRDMSALAALTLPRMEKLIEMDHLLGFPVVENLPGNARDSRDVYLILGSGRYPERGHDNPLHYSCLENPMDREAWWATVHGVTKYHI